MITSLVALNTNNLKNDSGTSLIETLVAVALLSVTALAVTHNSINTMAFAKRNIRNSYASELALSKLEELAAIDPSTLDASDNQVESSVVNNNVTFSRTTTITVNADQSRTATVLVSPIDSNLSGEVSLVNTFALWGNQ